MSGRSIAILCTLGLFRWIYGSNLFSGSEYDTGSKSAVRTIKAIVSAFDGFHCVVFTPLGNPSRQ